MLKWLEKKLIEKVIKDVIKELPKLKISAKQLIEVKKDYVIEEIKKAIRKKIMELAEKF